MTDTFNSRRHRRTETALGGRVQPAKTATKTLAQLIENYRQNFGREPTPIAVENMKLTASDISEQEKEEVRNGLGF